MSRTPCHRLALVALLSLLSMSGAWGQPPKAARAKPQFKPPVIPENVVLQRDVHYGEAGGHRLLLDILRPKQASARSRGRRSFSFTAAAGAAATRRARSDNLLPFAASGEYFCVSVELSPFGRGHLAGPDPRLQGRHPLAEGQRQEVQHRSREDRRLGRLGRRPPGEHVGRHRRRQGVGGRLRLARPVQPRGLRGRFLRPVRLPGHRQGQGDRRAQRLRAGRPSCWAVRSKRRQDAARPASPITYVSKDDAAVPDRPRHGRPRCPARRRPNRSTRP